MNSRAQSTVSPSEVSGSQWRPSSDETTQVASSDSGHATGPIKDSGHPAGAIGTHDLTITDTRGVRIPPSDKDHPEGLPELRFSYHMRYVVLYIVFLLICNFVIPVILFYPLFFYTGLSRRHIIGISSAALGLSSCFDAPFRLVRLTKKRTIFGPLGNDTWWHLDFVMWTYSLACIVFSIPLAIAAPIQYYNFFLMSTVMLICPIGVVFFVSLFSPKLKIWLSSDPPQTPMKPAAFYCIEDVAAVDFMHGREYRRAIHARYQASPPFRQLMRHITLYWTICSVLYCAVTALVTWLTPIHFAFGWILGQMFLWGAVCSYGCRFIVIRGLAKEKEWWRQNHVVQLEK